MILASLLVLGLAGPSQVLAEEYFPLTPGTRWTYREEGKFSTKAYDDLVLPAVEVGGQPAVPIQTSEGGRVLETVYYRALGDTILIVAYDAKKPLETPRPLFKVGPKKETWEFQGTTPFYEDLVPLEVKGESSPKGRRKVLEKDADCIEVKFEAQMMAAPGMVLKSNQTALYAKGIGLFEMTEKTVIGKNTDQRKLKLVSFQLGK